MPQQTDNNSAANSSINPELMMLPGPDSVKNSFTKLDASDGKSIKLDELGPMVVSTDGTLSRIANWTQMTDMERERTLRLLSARNKLRLANEEKKQQEGDLGGVDETEGMLIISQPSSILAASPPEANKT